MAARPTWESICGALAELPGTEFDPGGVVFPNGVVRVNGKVVAYPAGGDRGTPPDHVPGEAYVFVKASPSEREALLQQDPHTFFLTPHYQSSRGVIIRLSSVDPTQLDELLVGAWREVAPKRLIRQYDETLR